MSSERRALTGSFLSAVYRRVVAVTTTAWIARSHSSRPKKWGPAPPWQATLPSTSTKYRRSGAAPWASSIALSISSMIMGSPLRESALHDSATDSRSAFSAFASTGNQDSIDAYRAATDAAPNSRMASTVSALAGLPISTSRTASQDRSTSAITASSDWSMSMGMPTWAHDV